MKLVDMAREPEHGLTDVAAPPSATSPEPYYPYGLALNLDAEALEALGIDDVPMAGKEFHIEAFGVITNSSTSDPDADGDVDSVNLTLQIKHLGFEHEAEEDKQGPAARLYGPKGA